MKWWLTVALYFVSTYWRRILLFGGVSAIMAVGIVVLVMFVGRGSDPVEAAQSTPGPKTVAKVAPAKTIAPVVSTKAPIGVVEPILAPVVAKVRPTKAPVITPTQVPAVAPAPPPTAAVPSRIEVPVLLSRAQNVGSLEFVLVYEPQMLNLVEVKKGDLAGESLIDSGSRTPGRVWTALINTEGITGDGAVAVFTFEVLDSEATEGPLELKNVYAHDATSLLDLLAETSQGEFAVDGLEIAYPGLNFIN
jgi:hypothetical protein